MGGSHADGTRTMTGSDAGILFAASAMAGAVNSIAGGGSLITFPVLVWLGREPILANATNTVSLSPGSLAALHGYRRELTGLGQWVAWGTAPSIVGGVAGALLLLQTPAQVFAWLVPWLIFFATLLFALSGPITAAARRRAGHTAPADGVPRDPWRPGPLFYQFLVSVYGGYFGAGVGILMLAALGLMGLSNIHRMNGLKNWGGICMNIIAAVMFAFSSLVNWPVALAMAAGAVLGGYLGSRAAQRVPQDLVRGAVVAIGLISGLLLFLTR